MNNFLNYLLHSTILLSLVLVLIKLPYLRQAKARDVLLKTAMLISFLSPFLSNPFFSKAERTRIDLPALPLVQPQLDYDSFESNKPLLTSFGDFKEPSRTAILWSLIPIFLLALGTLLTCLRFFRAYWIIRGILSKSQRVIIEGLERNTEDIAAQFKFHAPVASPNFIPILSSVQSDDFAKCLVFSTPLISSPLAFGLNTILIPEQMLKQFSSKQLEAILAHEAAHLKRYDPLWNGLLSFLSGICFFQPLNFLALQVWRHAAEERCDAEAVQKTQDPLILAQSILQMTRVASPKNLLTTGMATQTHLRKRIEALLDPKEIIMKPWQLISLSLIPILLALALPLLSFAQGSKVVVLDAGHGGHDLGAVEGEIHEAAINLGVALKVKALLEQQGITVIMTRKKDRFVELESRLGVVTSETDIFLSLHTTYALSKEAHGIETWTAGNEKDEDIDNQTQLIAIERELAQKLQANLISATGAKDRGARENAFFVLRRSQIPSVLIEMGFISNPEEAQKLITEDYQQTLAQAISKTLVEFLD